MGSSVRSGGAVRSKQRAIAPSSAAHEILCYIIGLSHLGFEELLDTFEQGSGGSWFGNAPANKIRTTCGSDARH
jgi:hypothetical protein